MYQSNIKESGHVWEKKNLVTVSRNGKMFDEMVCVNCGMKGRRYGFESVEVSGSYNINKVNSCPNRQPITVPERIEITRCYASGPQFANLTPGSVHDVVEPPSGYANDERGVWVMGVGEPVKVLNNEFTPVKN